MPSHIDTSPQAVARVLRELVDELPADCGPEDEAYDSPERSAYRAEVNALADALDALQDDKCQRCGADPANPDTPCTIENGLCAYCTDHPDALPTVTWEERGDRASLAVVNLIGAWTDANGREERVATRRAIGDAALRAAFPELAPSDD
jgi:hypothetical protein